MPRLWAAKTRKGMLPSISVLLAAAMVMGGCATNNPESTALVSSVQAQRVVTKIINNACAGADADGDEAESNTTGKVKGLSKVKDGFGIPYDEKAKEYVCPPVPITDDSYEANKNRGIGYAGLESHYPQELADGQEHYPDHPDAGVEPGGNYPGLTTEEERYGCNMRWEYAGWEGPALGGHAVLGEISVEGYNNFLKGNGSGHYQYLAIHSLKTDKWCICCPYDYGPGTNLPHTGSEDYGRIGGVSPDTAAALGFEGDGSCPDAALTEWWWVENSEQVKCGPVNDLSEFTKGNKSGSGTSGSSSTSGTSASSSSASSSSSGSSSTAVSSEIAANTASIVTLTTKASSGSINPQITEHHDHGYGYWLYEARPGKKNQPLIVSLHGSGESGSDLSALRTSSLSRFILEGSLKPDCNVLMPQTTSNWNDPQALKSLIDSVVSSTKSNTKKISITGVSMGGFGTWNMLATYPDFFAAAAPVASSGTDGISTDGLSRCTAKVQALNGDADGYDASGVVSMIQGAKEVRVPGADHVTMCHIYGNEEYNPVPFLLGQTGSGKGGSSGNTIKIEPANPNSFIQKVDQSFIHGDMPKDKVKYIVMHDTELPVDAQATANSWQGSGKGVAAQFVVDKDGTIVQCVPVNKVAHHAGFGNAGHNEKFGVTDESRDDKVGTESIGDQYPDYGMNSHSVGIEIVHEHGSGEYPEAQLNMLDRLVAYLDQELGKEAEIIDHKTWRTTNSDCDTPTFPLENYQKTRNHLGVSTEEEAEEAGREGKCKDSDEDEDDGDSAGAAAIAEMAVKVAGVASPESQEEIGILTTEPTDVRWKDYVDAKKKVYGPEGDPAGIWASCCRMSIAVTASGADPDLPVGPCSAQHEYLSNSSKWETVGQLRSGDNCDEVLKPGDFLVWNGPAGASGAHTMVYVGNEAVKKKFPNSDANFVESHYNSGYPQASRQDQVFYGDFTIFRLKGSTKKKKKKNGSDAWADELCYTQWDPRWNDEIYEGSTTIGPAGCGLCSTAHILTLLYNDDSLTPPEVARRLRATSVTGFGIGQTNHEQLDKAIVEAFPEIEIEVVDPPNATTAKEALEDGKMLRLGIYGQVKQPSGEWRDANHVIMAYKYEGGKFCIKDSGPGDGNCIEYSESEFNSLMSGCVYMAIHAYKGGSTKKTKNGKKTTKTVKASRFVFVGDSRTNQMGGYLRDNLRSDFMDGELDASTAKSPSGMDELWIAKGAMAYDWFKDEAVPKLDQNVKSGDAIIIWMGVNGAPAYSAEYAELVNAKAKEWKQKGALTYYASVGPKSSGDDVVTKFNEDLKSKLSSDVTWIDVYGAIKNNFVAPDGLHYDETTYQKVYDCMTKGAAEGTITEEGTDDGDGTYDDGLGPVYVDVQKAG